MKKAFVLSALVLMLIAVFSACGGGGGGSIPFFPGGGTSTPTLDSIAVTPASLTIATSSNQQFTATGNYSDGSTQDLTSSASWNSSDAIIAAVSNAGLATAGRTNAGSTTISASYGGISGNTTLKVTIRFPKTGQTACYDSSGNVISCTNTGQDGDLQKGVAWPSPRFTDNGDGTMIDNLTGLIWLKNANCFGTRTWAQALTDANALASGTCGLTDGSQAGDWRLPNRKELRSLIHYGETNTATWLNGQGFSSVQADIYWPSNTSPANPTWTWIVRMRDGVIALTPKSGSYYVLPVRAGL